MNIALKPAIKLDPSAEELSGTVLYNAAFRQRLE